nr:diguanylate cyclase [uncultured Desulfobacter sp.]
MKLVERILALGNLLDFSDTAYIETDLSLRVLVWNPVAKKLFHHSENQALGEYLDNLIPVDKDCLLNCTCTERRTIDIQDKAGKTCSCQITYTPIMSLEAEKLGISMIAAKTDTGKMGPGLKVLPKQKIQEMCNIAPIGIYHVSLEGKLTMANSEYAWMLGYESPEAAVSQIHDFAQQVFFDQEKAEEFMFNVLEADQIISFRSRLRRKDNSPVWALCYAKVTRSKSGRVNGFNGFSIDISAAVRTEKALEAANEKLKFASIMDGLTQIPNRRFFDETLSKEWNRHIRENKELAVILCDIDYFKPYNDTYGHQTGDKCLKEVARTIHGSTLRAGDLAARYGGEEFVLILPNTNLDGAKEVAERVRKAVAALKIPHEGSSVAPHVTLSLGIAAVIPNQNASADNLVELADQALYEAKEGGRNQSIGKQMS